MPHLEDALKMIRAESDSHARAGRTFEELVAEALRAHPDRWGKERFSQVWTWKDWPGRAAAGYESAADIGVDLVAEQTPEWGGGPCAVQCKMYSGKVPTKGVDSFLAAAPESIFRTALLVVTAPVDANGLKKMEARSGGKTLDIGKMDDWVEDWRELVPRAAPVKLREPVRKSPKPHQEEALAKIRAGWESGADRGQLILPCGTGKTLTSLWAAVDATEPGDAILFLVPSLALMSQTMQEWSEQKPVPLQFLAVCSDVGVGRRTRNQEGLEVRLEELFAEVTTSADGIAAALAAPIPDGCRRAVFSTYQSSPTLAEAAAAAGTSFEIAVFDEAHRTTGVDVADGGAFQTALYDENIPAARRLFMTATPRVFTDKQKEKIDVGAFDGDSYSMADEETYGPEFYYMSFADAVEKKLLSDYKLQVVIVDDPAHLRQDDSVLFDWKNITPGFQPQGKKTDGEKQPDLAYNDALRLAGCWDALASPYSFGWREDHVTGKIDEELGEPAAAALLYANRVSRSNEAAQVWADLAAHEADGSQKPGDRFLELGVEHMDGTTPALQRTAQLNRLRDASEKRGGRRCEVISNVRVLTEGVDVPGLDAVVFLDARASRIDVTQAVGRAMRRAEGKKEGHVVIPVVMGVGEDADEKLAKSAYAEIAYVLRALRSHDKRIDYYLSDPKLMEKFLGVRYLGGGSGEGSSRRRIEMDQLVLELTQKVASAMVDKVGDRRMWPTWGEKAGEAANAIHAKLRKAIYGSTEATRVFVGMCDDFEQVGIEASPEEVMEAVAHHIVTIPIFDAMFGDRFSKDNPVSQGIDRVLAALESEGVSFDADRRVLHRSYERLRETLADHERAAAESGDLFGKADVIRQIYDGFFARGMAEKVKQLGMVYTPQWIVDFMLRSVDAVCKKHFGGGIDQNVRFLDPFAGTGIFPTRLLTAKGGEGEYLVSDARLEEAWGNLYGGEIMLLPYYAAALGVEESYRRRLQERDGADPGYRPWPGLALQDSMLTDGVQWKLEGMGENVARAARLAGTKVDVICTNPPWKPGAKKEGEVGKKEYPAVAARIKDTYDKRRAELGRKSGGNQMGDLYVHAFRWSADRLAEGDGKGKVLAMVHPNSVLEGSGGSAAGLRAGLADDFTDIYCVNLRGSTRKYDPKEGENAFKVGREAKSRSGAQITILVRDPSRRGQKARVRTAEAADYLKVDEKRRWLEEEVGDVTSPLLREAEVGDDHWWGKKADPVWAELTALAGDEQIVATGRDAPGIKTGGDDLFVSRSPDLLAERIRDLIDEYDHLRKIAWMGGKKPSKERVDQLCEDTPLHSVGKLKTRLRQGREIVFDAAHITPILYRPFDRRFLYADPDILSRYPVELRGWATERAILYKRSRILATQIPGELHAGGTGPQATRFCRR